ncbi:DNA-binding transcriptional LysR family regulator [Marinobacter sp. 3-2]|jgi:DNA-binding transcriptional LysR family regulator|uniref:LysR family transcriptional regulator n=1 Tax=Marinobacter sp. 3-2 TaxID=2485141 RepID=UPI000D3D8DDC|nr:LysR family transcriptional regulator [Marinobacter sp. 3-2]ROQ43107.1 DNA-binding transcriptional LysR family regulator [Marinobacter sp. 3-2]
MDKIALMRVFVEAAERESFVGASQRLDMSAPAVTRAIAQLEGSLGVRLFNRTTRRVRLTESGNRYFQDAKRILEEIEEVESALLGVYREPKGILSVTAPVLFGRKYIVPILIEFLDRHPELRVKAVFYDRVSNILDEGLDVAIRIGNLKDSSQFAVRVGNVQKVVCGSPDYLSKHGLPNHPADLADHQIIQSSAVEPSTTWWFESSEGKTSVRVSPRLQFNQNDSAISAVKSGYGITRLMSYQVGEEFQTGSLVRILQEHEPEPIPINIVYLEGLRASAKIRSFVDLAKERLQNNPLINHQMKP